MVKYFVWKKKISLKLYIYVWHNEDIMRNIDIDKWRVSRYIKNK